MTTACLYIVATPIGNRDDFTRRAIDVLQSVDVIAAEDTRHSKRLLDYYQIKTPMISLHEHNELQRLKSVIDSLEQHKTVALISDAGTPLISDPGYRLVSEVQSKGFRVIPVPGACAAIAALCASGLPTDRFIFEGFLPAKRGSRKNYLQNLLDETRTLIFYESTHRIVECLEDMLTVFGAERRVTVARELTKSFETIHQDTLPSLLDWIQADNNQQKGEFVLVVEGLVASQVEPDQQEAERVLSILLAEMPLKQAVSIATEITGGHRKSLYQLALDLKTRLKLQ